MNTTEKTHVDFDLLVRLVHEGPYDPAQTIALLAMCDIPMSEAVIDLGIVTDVLLPGYVNGWSKEDP